VVGPNLAAFIQKFRSATANEVIRKTRVALIDSGVVIVGGKGTILAEEKAREAQNKGQSSKDGQRAEQPLDDKKQWRTNDLARHVDGKSFVSTGDDEEQVWWHASEAHGTQMARLICSIDPCCELYVVKLPVQRDVNSLGKSAFNRSNDGLFTSVR
jgi:hypothetical protein